MPNLENTRRTVLGQLGLGVTLSIALMGCAVEAAPDDTAVVEEGILIGNINAEINNPTGRHRILQKADRGANTTATTNVNTAGHPFFTAFPNTNGRACVDCHQPAAAMGITPSQVRQAFNATSPRGLDPVFRLFDGANGPTAPVATEQQREQAYSLLLSDALIRIPFTVAGNRDFDIRVVRNQYPNVGANPVEGTSIPRGAAANLSVYRRPLLSANTRFISAVMWDGREVAARNPVAAGPGSGQRIAADQNGAPVFENMRVQSNNATRGHAEALADIPENSRTAIVDFQMRLVVAQIFDNQAGALNQNGGNGGPAPLMTQQTFFGINDSHGGNPIAGTPFNPSAMSVFNGFANSTNARRASIERGQRVFNTKPINISGVRGVNDALGVPNLAGTCTTCHSHPNVGNHTDILPLDVGISDVGKGDNNLPVFAITSIATGQRVETTDPGRAFVTGRFADLNKQKGPTLRALSSRPPFFHNGAADSIDEVITFYRERFNIPFQCNAQGHCEANDLKAFLEAL